MLAFYTDILRARFCKNKRENIYNKPIRVYVSLDSSRYIYKQTNIDITHALYHF